MSIVIENVSFQSEGFPLLGRIYRPAPDGKYPAVALCHGYPGDTKNMDLAEELTLNGVVTLVFYYQGAWGSKGAYRFSKLEPSTRDAVAYLRAQPYVDTDRVGLVSHSMGALPLVRRLSLDPTIKTAVLMSPVSDISLWTRGDAMETVIPHFIESAKGKLEGMTADQLRVDLRDVTETGNPIDLIGVVKAPLLIVVGSDDDVTPPDLCKVLYDKAREPKKWVLVDRADHGFSEHRVLLIRAVLDWLKITI
ncbi:MAG: prolyl oligopeptidase family serine peptidase [Candidatus Bathyarchaeota archaeon]|nr:prolyl oligopeptidase family serine peptidase [Candidatus Bathyarchaeota archaeon]